MTGHTKQDFIHARETLYKLFPRGSTIYTRCESSRSGMSGTVHVYATLGDAIFKPTWAVHVVSGRPITKDNGLRVNGGGFDRGYDVAEDIAIALGGQLGLTHRHEHLS